MHEQQKTTVQVMCTVLDPTRTMSHRIACYALACFAVCMGPIGISTLFGIYFKNPAMPMTALSYVILWAGFMGMLACMMQSVLEAKRHTKEERSVT